MHWLWRLLLLRWPFLVLILLIYKHGRSFYLSTFWGLLWFLSVGTWSSGYIVLLLAWLDLLQGIWYYFHIIQILLSPYRVAISTWHCNVYSKLLLSKCCVTLTQHYFFDMSMKAVLPKVGQQKEWGWTFNPIQGRERERGLGLWQNTISVHVKNLAKTRN